ncbi:hypothetical protein NM09_04775 [Vibrio caribbeanicus]|uniref:Uncharacterized protein n=1 Tax=Vibrio caribbeanicus TaxID=701175 RepID=A0ACC4P088_9VIBR|nr:hypothetical protein NM09_04775 [Vibrio caribbeanicus]KIE21987.1 hypothetical protein SE23_07210 [Vibrio sinaloensis]
MEGILQPFSITAFSSLFLASIFLLFMVNRHLNGEWILTHVFGESRGAYITYKARAPGLRWFFWGGLREKHGFNKCDL